MREHRRRPTRRLPTNRWALIGIVVAVGCGESEVGQPSSTTVQASDLAPSQISVSTVAPPESPPPCDPSLLSWATEPGTDPSTAAVLTVTNASGVQCEVDVSASPGFDPLMEPDVWLDAGASALLEVGATVSGCDSATEATSIELDVNGRSRRVDLPAAACAPALVAFYPA